MIGIHIRRRAENDAGKIYRILKDTPDMSDLLNFTGKTALAVGGLQRDWHATA